MADAVLKPVPMSEQEYLKLELASPLRHELVDGFAYAMGGASDRHNLIASDLYIALAGHLPSRCQVFMADTKLRIGLASDALFNYPDTLVTCAPDDRDPCFREKPILLAEVLSPSTERIDRKEKPEAYRCIPTLAEHVLIDQDRPVVEIFRRRTGWTREQLGPGERLVLESVALELPVERLYRRPDVIGGA